MENLEFYKFDVLTSTMDKAKEIFEAAPTSLVPKVILADSQTKGRGKPGRHWEGQKGNLFVTLLIPGSFNLSCFSTLSLLSGLSLYQSLAELHKDLKKPTLELKWPNDLLLKGKKVSGILCEAGEIDLKTATCSYLLVGVGVNCDNAPTLTSYETASLKDYDITKESLLESFLACFFKNFNHWKTQGFSKTLHSQWEEAAMDQNTPITIMHANKEQKATYQGITQKGELQAQLEDGRFLVLSSGEVFYG